MIKILKKHKYLFIFGFPVLIMVGIVNFDSTERSDTQQTIISLAPEGGSFVIDQNLLVTVKVNTNAAINAVEATINFPKDNLSVVSVSKDDSIINLWIQEPSFSNELGVIEFVGGLHNGGFQGEGKILTIVFKPKKPGNTTIDFANASVLAHDGKGTDVLEKKIGATYFIKTENPSPDFNSDNRVNLTDLSILLSHWGSVDDFSYDLNQDGKVGLVDLSILISKFGKL